MLPLFILLSTYKLGLLWVGVLAGCGLFFKALNMIVNARGWKLIARYPKEISEQNPLQRIMVRYLGYWGAETIGLVIFMGLPIAALWAFWGPEFALIPIASLSPMSVIMFLNDVEVVRLVEQRAERYNKG